MANETKNIPEHEVWMLATVIPLEPAPDQKQNVILHHELGWFSAEHLADKGKKSRPLKVVQVKKAE